MTDPWTVVRSTKLPALSVE